MDDLLKSIEIEEQAVSIKNQLIELMQIGGFNLTKLESNTKEVMDFSATQNISHSSVTFDKEGEMFNEYWRYWNITDDNFFFSSKIVVSPPTNHRVLIAVSTMFDQIGFLAPFIMKTKLLLQSMWRLKIG